MPEQAQQVHLALELASEAVEDLTPLVYARLFAAHPDMEPLFWRDTNHQIKGEMLSQVFRAILDFVGDRQYAARLIQCEVVTHAGYDVPPEVFRVFFGTVRDTLREVIAGNWTPDMDTAWSKLLTDLDYYVLNTDQSQTVDAA